MSAVNKISGKGKVGPNLVAAGMDRLLQDESSDSYRVAYKILFGIVAMLTLVICGSSALLFYTIKQGRTGDRFYAMSFDGKKIPLQSLSTPSLNAVAMCAWASQAATDILTYGFDDIGERMGAVHSYFTDIGYESYMRAAKASGLVKTIQQNQQIMTAIPGGPATVVYEGLRQGEYVWDISVPIVLTVRAGEQSLSARPALTVSIVRVPTIQNPSGFGIQQWIMF
jgi:intracellular multiplication protein IcmL